MRECGTSLRNLVKKSLRKQTSERNAEPAEPFPTNFVKARNYRKNMRKSELCRFRMFRIWWQLVGSDEMCGKRFRRFRTHRWPAVNAMMQTGLAASFVVAPGVGSLLQLDRGDAE